MNIKNAPGIAGGLLAGFCLGGVLWAKAAPPAAAPLTAAENKERALHTAWVRQTYDRISAIKPGDTRANLFKMFSVAGGLHAGPGRVYAYRDCSNI